MRMRLVPLLIFCIACISGFAQKKDIQAVKAVLSPRIDGNLDDDAWKQAPVASDFIQNFPSNGSPSSVRTEVKILYDDEAIYVGAFMHGCLLPGGKQHFQNPFSIF